jgi:hypothetical protein
VRALDLGSAFRRWGGISAEFPGIVVAIDYLLPSG